MHATSRFRTLALSLLLPAVLLLLTALLTGCYYETNDDLTISLLLRGLLAAEPVADLQLYLHGFSRVLVWLYRQWPAWPWYGLLLYGCLYAATTAAFVLLLRHLPARLRLWQLLTILTLFFACVWLEHAMWFSFVRVAVLLGGVAVLLPALKPQQLGIGSLLAGLALLALGLCLREKAALLGAALALPAGWWLSGNPPLVPHLLRLLPFALLASALHLLFSQPEQEGYRKLNALKSEVNDYARLELHPQSLKDSLAAKAVANWFLADTALVSPAFYERASSSDLRSFWQHTAPRKLLQTLQTLAWDYFLALGVLLALSFLRWQSVLPHRRWYVLYQALCWLLLLGLGVWLKLPPRLAGSCLTVLVLANLLVGLRQPGNFVAHDGRRLRPALYLFLLLLLPYVYKVGHRALVQAERQRQNEQAVHHLATAYRQQTLVTTALGERFLSLSPFRNYGFGSNRLLSLTGWPTLQPAYSRYLHRLTGTPKPAAALAVLARQPDVVWLLSPSMAAFLPRYLQLQLGQPWQAEPLVPAAAPPPGFQLRPYQLRPR